MTTHPAATPGRRTAEEPAMPPRIVTIGETMALLGTPDHCLLRPGAGPSLTVGGAESNVAIAAARLKCTMYIGAWWVASRSSTVSCTGVVTHS